MSKAKKEVEDEVEDVEEDEEEEDEETGAAEETEATGAEAEEEKKIEDIRNADVVTKYRTASDIAQAALKEVIKAAVPGAKVFDLCVLGDKFITDATSKIYRQGKKVTKGVGFPTCVSLNNLVGSVSPLAEDQSAVAEGDVVKVDLGVQVDGYVSQVAHTFVAGSGAADGRKADVIVAAYTAAEAALRMMKPGVKNTEITAVIDKVAKEFHVSTVQGVFSHQVKRFEIDAEKVVANNIPDVPLTGENKTKEFTLEANESWALDFVMSTGTGKPSEAPLRTTVYKRMPDETYQLKMKTSRAVLSEIDNKFPTFPFTIRALETDEKKMKFGVVECSKHRLLEAYPVLTEKQGDFVAHFKFTALMLPSGTSKITGLPVDTTLVKSQYAVQDADLKALLAKSAKSNASKNKAKKKKAKAKKAAAPAPAVPAAK
jgi:curved DNA binding protein